MLRKSFQDLATEVAPLYKRLAPQAYQNQVLGLGLSSAHVTPHLCPAPCGVAVAEWAPDGKAQPVLQQRCRSLLRPRVCARLTTPRTLLYS